MTDEIFCVAVKSAGNIFGKREDKVIVEGVNIVKKHQKPSNSNPNSGVIDTEAAINASNVMLIDPSTNEPTRVGYKFVDGKKVRVAKKSGKTLD